MEQEFLFQGEHIIYSLKRSLRARRLRLTVDTDGQLVVTVPRSIPADRIEGLIREHGSWILRQRARQRAKPRHSLPAINDRSAYQTYKPIAKEVVQQSLLLLKGKIAIPPYTVTIKNHRTRWGSCSRRGGLNFNYRIALLPNELAEYIIVHEVCHLFELNHSNRFWNRVAAFLPNYVLLRKQLRAYTWKKD